MHFLLTDKYACAFNALLNYEYELCLQSITELKQLYPEGIARRQILHFHLSYLSLIGSCWGLESWTVSPCLWVVSPSKRWIVIQTNLMPSSMGPLERWCFQTSNPKVKLIGQLLNSQFKANPPERCHWHHRQEHSGQRWLSISLPRCT